LSREKKKNTCNPLGSDFRTLGQTGPGGTPHLTQVRIINKTIFRNQLWTHYSAILWWLAPREKNQILKVYSYPACLCYESPHSQAISHSVFLTAYMTFGRFKGHVCSQENGVGDSLGTRLHYEHIWPL